MPPDPGGSIKQASCGWNYLGAQVSKVEEQGNCPHLAAIMDPSTVMHGNHLQHHLTQQPVVDLGQSHALHLRCSSTLPAVSLRPVQRYEPTDRINYWLGLQPRSRLVSVEFGCGTSVLSLRALGGALLGAGATRRPRCCSFCVPICIALLGARTEASLLVCSELVNGQVRV